jgi:hypothetical protein
VLSVPFNDKGVFLNWAINFLKDEPDYIGEVLQCYHCLFGFTSKIDHEFVIDDHVGLVQDEPRSEEIIEFSNVVLKYLGMKMSQRSFRGVSSDAKECLSQITDAVAPIVWSDSNLNKNAEIISKHLHSPFNFSDTSPCHALSCHSPVDQEGKNFGISILKCQQYFLTF